MWKVKAMGWISLLSNINTLASFDSKLAILCYIELRCWSIDDAVKLLLVVDSPVKYWNFRGYTRDYESALLVVGWSICWDFVKEEWKENG